MNDMDKCPDAIGAKQTVVYTLPAELACMAPSEREFATMVSLATEIGEAMDADVWADLLDIMQGALCGCADGKTVEKDAEQCRELTMDCDVYTCESGGLCLVIPFAGGFTEEELDAIIESMPEMVRNVMQGHYGETITSTDEVDADFIAEVRDWYISQNDKDCRLFIGIDITEEDAMEAAAQFNCDGAIGICTHDDDEDDDVVEMPDVDSSSFEDEFKHMMNNIVDFVTNCQSAVPASDAVLDFEVNDQLDTCVMVTTVDLTVLDDDKHTVHELIRNTADDLMCEVIDRLDCTHGDGSGNITVDVCVEDMRRKVAWFLFSSWHDGASSVDVAFTWITPERYQAEMLTAVEYSNGAMVHERPFYVVPVWKYLDLFTDMVDWDEVSSVSEWNRLRLDWLMDHGFANDHAGGNCVDELMGLDRALMVRLPFHTEMYNDLVRNMDRYMMLYLS